jgi:hypothetical protein
MMMGLGKRRGPNYRAISDGGISYEALQYFPQIILSES